MEYWYSDGVTPASPIVQAALAIGILLISAATAYYIICQA